MQGHQLITLFVISENLQDDLSSYDEIDSHDNFSDHIAVKCVLNVNVIYCHRSATVQEKTSLPAWSKSTNEQIIADQSVLNAWSKSIKEQIIADQSVLNDKLNNIILLYEAALCNK